MKYRICEREFEGEKEYKVQRRERFLIFSYWKDIYYDYLCEIWHRQWVSRKESAEKIIVSDQENQERIRKITGLNNAKVKCCGMY